MIPRGGAVAAAVAVVVLSAPASAQADDCSGLSDCAAGTKIAVAVLAISVVLAIGLALAGVMAGPAAEAAASEGEPPTEPPELRARLDAIAARYESMIFAARGLGANVAADNLQRFLEGTGSPAPGAEPLLSADFLRGHFAVRAAERVNQERFERTLKKIAGEMKDGETREFTDYWDRAFMAFPISELYYASGTSQLTSKGTFELSKTGDKVTVRGHVDHRWHDDYNWNKGALAEVPGFGKVSDDDALLLKQYRGAKDFEMVTEWQQTVTGTIAGGSDLGVGPHLVGEAPGTLRWHGP